MIGPLREHHARWLDFALRLVGVHYGLTDEERAELRREVAGFIHDLLHDYVDPRQWDAPMVYRPQPEDRARDCIGDLATEWCWSRWHEPYDMHPDEMPDGELVYHSFEELRALREDHEAFERMAGPFRACVRAGLDMACEPSGGVLGYTVGDLRTMYPEGVPGWLVDAFEVDRESFDAAPANAGVWL
jgi:hypothetical protein